MIQNTDIKEVVSQSGYSEHCFPSVAKDPVLAEAKSTWGSLSGAGGRKLSYTASQGRGEKGGVPGVREATVSQTPVICMRPSVFLSHVPLGLVFICSGQFSQLIQNGYYLTGLMG